MGKIQVLSGPNDPRRSVNLYAVGERIAKRGSKLCVSRTCNVRWGVESEFASSTIVAEGGRRQETARHARIGEGRDKSKIRVIN